MFERILTAPQFARMIGTSRQSVWRWCQDGLFGDLAQQLDNGQWLIKWTPLTMACVPPDMLPLDERGGVYLPSPDRPHPLIAKRQVPKRGRPRKREKPPHRGN